MHWERLGFSTNDYYLPPKPTKEEQPGHGMMLNTHVSQILGPLHENKARKHTFSPHGLGRGFVVSKISKRKLELQTVESLRSSVSARGQDTDRPMLWRNTLESDIFGA